MAQYLKGKLDSSDLSEDPFYELDKWIAEARSLKIDDPNAMALATATLEGVPSSRMVLIHRMGPHHLWFFTNYESRKGKELVNSPWISGTFFWRELQRQVVLQGKAFPLSAKDSDTYFSDRPRESQIGAWASSQGKELVSRKSLEESYARYENQFAGKEVPRPPHWGGFEISPTAFEFWQGREHRLHDRFVYFLEDSKWIIKRLSP